MSREYLPIRIRWFSTIHYFIFGRIGFFLQEKNTNHVNSDQKDTANGQSTLFNVRTKWTVRTGNFFFFHFVEQAEISKRHLNS